MSSITTDELRKVIALQDQPDTLLRWILDHGEYKEYEDGAILSKTGQPINDMWMVIEGKALYYQDINGRLIHYFTFENTVATGGAGGLLPYSRMKATQGTTIAAGPLRVVTLHKKYFHELEQKNPEFIQRLIGYMTERARTFATLQLQQEKISALGKLSAGIAHELNNPSSAITRIAIELKKKWLLNYELTECLLLLQKLDPEQVEILRERAIAQALQASTTPGLTTLQKFEREDEICDWLERNGIEDNRQIGETMTAAGWSVDDFQRMLDTIGQEAFLPVLRWLENLLTAAWLLTDLEEASTRISLLVGALKSHVHMDRTSDMVPTNLHRDIDNTLTLLGYKLRQKNITVKRNYAPALPEIEAFVGELNQVWSNIIDNAIYAMDQNGELTIDTSREGNEVQVRITDTGSGIPAEILSRIFEPYFTTKQAGDGSGIGLDIVNRVIKNHHGKIHVESVPGKTEFKIHLPVCQTKEEPVLLEKNKSRKA